MRFDRYPATEHNHSNSEIGLEALKANEAGAEAYESEFVASRKVLRATDDEVGLEALRANEPPIEAYESEFVGSGNLLRATDDEVGEETNAIELVDVEVSREGDSEASTRFVAVRPPSPEPVKSPPGGSVPSFLRRFWFLTLVGTVLVLGTVGFTYEEWIAPDSRTPTSNQSSRNCHPSYAGACVPIGVSDVDCRGGSGNGPYFVGRVTVVGSDVYGLDRDNDGIGCE